jgi:cobalt-zinc-cadmium efflux system outer membrane protein
VTGRAERVRSQLVLAVVALAGRPAAADVLRLDDGLARARTANPALRAASADVEAALGRHRQAGLVPANPVLAADLASRRKPGDDTLDRGVSLSQEVEVGGQRGLRIGAEAHDVARARYRLADRERTVDAEVRRAFAGAVAADERRRLAADSVRLVTRLADAIRRRVAAGDVGELDERLADVEAARAAQALASAVVERARAVARVANAIGARPDAAFDVAREEPPVGRMPGEAELLALALDSRPDLGAAKEEAARLDAEAALARRRGLVPNPVFRGFFRVESGNERIAGGEVAIPLPVWNREQGTETALRAGAAAARAEVERLTREIPRQVHVAVVRRTEAAAAWRRWKREALPAAAAAHELVDRAYAGGYVGLPDVLVAQDRLVQARAAAIGAALDLAEAHADLVEAIGRVP